MINAKLLNQAKSENIECYTPRYLVDLILEFLPKDKTIWCPFSVPDHYFGNYLRDKGYTVINSSILTGQDFLKWEPKKWDLILDNPPFKNKGVYFKRAFELGKPFAFVAPMTTLNDAGIPNLFIEFNKDLELLIPNKRPEFIRINDASQRQRISFKVGYFCRGILPKQIIFKEIDKVKIEPVEREKFIKIFNQYGEVNND